MHCVGRHSRENLGALTSTPRSASTSCRPLLSTKDACFGRYAFGTRASRCRLTAATAAIASVRRLVSSAGSDVAKVSSTEIARRRRWLRAGLSLSIYAADLSSTSLRNCCKISAIGCRFRYTVLLSTINAFRTALSAF